MCNVVKGKWFGFFCILAILALASLTNAAASFQVTLLKSAPPNDDNALAFNDWGDANELDANGYPAGGGGSSSRQVRWSKYLAADDSVQILRNEQGQSFRFLRADVNDANMGGVAFQLRLVPLDPCDPNIIQAIRETNSGNEVFVISLYEMRTFKDPQLKDDKLLMQWSGKIPAGLDTDPCDSNTAQLGDWLKFTFDKGYQLFKDKTYAVRFGWQSSLQELAADPNLFRCIYIESSSIKQLAYDGNGVYLDPNAYANTGDGGTYIPWAAGCVSSPGRMMRYDWDSTVPDDYLHQPGGPGDQKAYWQNSGLDIDFAILKAETQPICYGCPAGDATKDCEVKLDDFVRLASNWKSDVTLTGRTALEYFFSNADDPMFASDPPPENIIVLNNALPQPDNPRQFEEKYVSPIDGWPNYIGWTKNYARYVDNPDTNDANNGHILENQWAQSFRAPRTVGMNAIAVQTAGAISGPVSQNTDAQEYLLKIYEVNDINSPPADPNLYPNYPTTLLASFPGQWYSRSPSYLTLSFIGRPGNWVTFVLPQTIQLTAGHCYAFALEWKYGIGGPGQPNASDPRKWRVDASESNSLDPEYDGPEGTYAEGKGWRRTYYDDVNQVLGPYTDYKLDVEFAIMGPFTWCQAQEHSKGANYNSPDTGVGYVYNRVTPGDFNHDCKVDMKDMRILADTWLESGIL